MLYDCYKNAMHGKKKLNAISKISYFHALQNIDSAINPQVSKFNCSQLQKKSGQFYSTQLWATLLCTIIRLYKHFLHATYI
jgi:hypothetical protein